MASAVSSISQDASSLRAAALLTLKARAKFRPQPPAYSDRSPHQDDASSVASTKRAAPSPELNYGSEDGLADAEGSTEEEEEESGEKEEGEISDDEAAVTAKPTQSMMDVDNEPLPGLTSSDERFKGPGVTTFPDMKGQKPQIFSQASSESRPIGDNSALPNAPTSATSGQSSTVPIRTSTPVPTSKHFPASRSSLETRALELSAMSQAVDSHARAPSLLTQPPKPSLITRSSPSRPITHPSSQYDATPQAYVPNLNDEQARGTQSIGSSSALVPPSRPLPPQASRSVVDHAHARPSLKMTDHEFVEAKTIILDLLGWGVPSEYFINCGLTREAIYYAFSEMNLKLPTNLDADGIMQYGPPKYHTSDPQLDPPSIHDKDQVLQMPSAGSQPSQQPTKPASDHVASRDSQFSIVGQPAQTQGHATTSHAPPQPQPSKLNPVSPPPSSPSTYGSSKSQSSVQHESLLAGPSPAHNGNGGVINGESASNQPSTSQVGSTIPGLTGQLTSWTSQSSSVAAKPSTSAQPGVPAKPSSLSSSLAGTPTHGYSGNLDEIETQRRQELLARKAVLASRKPKPIASGSPVPTPRVTTSRTNSLAPPASMTSNEKPPIPPETVDDFLKSITSGVSEGHSNSDPTIHPPLTRSPDSMDMDVDAKHEVPTSAETGPSFYEGSQAYAAQGTLLARKGSNRRPVASDFVDYEAHPYARRSPFATSSDHNAGTSSNGKSRGQVVSTPSFSNLAPSRKVVIDFSDTEDEEGGDLSNGPSLTIQQRFPPGTYAPTPVMAHIAIGRSASASTSTPGPQSPAPPSHITPAALLAKEEEIKRMKELIAQRELNRLKKLLHMPKSTVPPGSQAPPRTSSPSEPVPSPGVEPVDPEIAQSPTAVQPEETADVYVDSQSKFDRGDSVTSIYGDDSDEDAVMKDTFAHDASNADMSTTSTPPSTDTVMEDSQSALPGEQVLTAEAGHEQVMDSEVIETTDEPQVEDLSFRDHCAPRWASGDHEASPGQQISKRFQAYTSPLSSFVSFRSPTQLDSTFDNSFSSPSTPNVSSLNSSIRSFVIDTPISPQVPTLARSLREATLLKLDPKRSICQFEIPGAGKCRDQTCQNVHLCAFEPNDDETARHLAKALPAPRPTVQEVRSALSRVRASSKQELDLDTRISQVLLHLGVR